MQFKPGNFQLVVKVGSREVPAHNGTVTRDNARRLQKSYKVALPTAKTRVVRATA